MNLSALIAGARFAARAWVEQALADKSSPEAFAPTHAPAVIDNLNAFGFRDLNAMTKRSRGTRRLDDLTIGVVHQMATPFGTRSSARARWRARASSCAPEVLVDPALTDKWAETMAHRERFWNVPYHYVITLGGDVLHNQPLAWRTWHGDAGNGGIGIGFEGNFPAFERNRAAKHNTLDEDRAVACLVAAIRHARSSGAPLVQLQAHRNYAPQSSRGGDPGELIWRRVVLPAVEQTDCTIDYNAKAGGGAPIPRGWDDRARYDNKGNRIV